MKSLSVKFAVVLTSVGLFIFASAEARYTYGKPGQTGWRLSMKYPILMLNTSRFFFILLPFYYLIALPVALVFNLFDVYGRHKTGTGLLMVAKK